MDKARILIVDDQEEILQSLGGVLSDEGHEVFTATDGQDALHIVQSDAPDVVFLDIWIPGIDGMQTLKAIRRIDADCSVIMMSGHGTIETAVKAIKLGASDYLEKPLNLEDVLHLVEKGINARARSRRLKKLTGVGPGALIGKSDQAVRLRRSIELAASEHQPVWLVGEKGTGKEFAARVIHHAARREPSAPVKVRCQDVDETNFDDVFFGKSNGGSGPRIGRIEQATGGTLLLMRLDRLPKALRPRLKEVIRGVGASGASSAKRGLGARLVATSDIDPEKLVRDDEFPSEVAEALGARIIRLPTLRERPEDIPLFVTHFVEEAAAEFDRNITSVDGDALTRLLTYQWPGNVKELKILMEHVVMTAPGPAISVNDLLMPVHSSREGVTVGDGAESSLEATREQGSHGMGTHQGHIGSGSGAAFSRTLHGEEKPLHQKTIKANAVMYGQGLHSGVKTGLTLSPLPPGSGILFGHITAQGTVPAILENVESTGFATCLRGNGAVARTVEHVLAALHVYGLTNLLVKVAGEVPIMDGSALEFCNLLESAEIIVQDEHVEPIRIKEPLEITFQGSGDKALRLEPADCLEVEYYLDYPPPVGRMHMLYRCESPEDFKAQIAPARTFGFVKDMQMMDEMGLAGGGKLSNLILLDGEKVVNPPLRFPDEFVRHKILDIIGDFYLLGRPFRGRIVARGTGHTENIVMLKRVRETM
ncbi:MAG: UDP-3-O-acyl-N-acetylglucosamine deacetylase [Pseudomonadota bacterium]